MTQKELSETVFKKCPVAFSNDKNEAIIWTNAVFTHWKFRNLLEKYSVENISVECETIYDDETAIAIFLNVNGYQYEIDEWVF